MVKKLVKKLEQNMKKKTGKYLLMAALSGVIAILLGLSAAAWGSLLLTNDMAGFCLKQPVTIQEALAAKEQNQQIKEEFRQGKTEKGKPLDFCIWGRKEDVLLSNKNLSRQMEADAVFLCGNPELVFPDSRIPVSEDTAGCLVDEETAWELFGSSEVVGKEITCEEQNYTIRKVIAAREPFIAFQVSSFQEENNETPGEAKTGAQPEYPDGKTERAQTLDRLAVRRTKEDSVSDLKSICINRYGFSPEILDLELLRGLGGACLLLAPVTICIFFGRRLYHLCRKQEDFPWKAAAAGACLLLAVLLLFFLKDRVRIPDEYIPTRWSEFSFWSNLWREKTEGIKLLVRIPKSGPDSQWMKGFFQSAACGLLAEVFVVTGEIFLQQDETYKKR